MAKARKKGKKDRGGKPFKPCNEDFKERVIPALEDPSSNQGKICWACHKLTQCARKAGQITGGGGPKDRSYRNSF